MHDAAIAQNHLNACILNGGVESFLIVLHVSPWCLALAMRCSMECILPTNCAGKMKQKSTIDAQLISNIDINRWQQRLHPAGKP
jgi:hypothetical protein